MNYQFYCNCCELDDSIKYVYSVNISFFPGFPGPPSSEGIICSKTRVSPRDPNRDSLLPGFYHFTIFQYSHVY